MSFEAKLTDVLWGFRRAVARWKSRGVRQRVFMCKTDWDYEVGWAAGGNKFYASEADLRANRPCSKKCGVVEVEMRLKRVVQDEVDELD